MVLGGVMNIAKRCLVTLLAIATGLLIANGVFWLYGELAGPFYPDSTQQQRNFDNYLIGSLVVIVASGIVGNIIYGYWKRQ